MLEDQDDDLIFAESC